MAIAFSQQGSAQGAAGTTTLPVSITINAGDTVVVFVNSGSVNPPYGISDNGGNSYVSQGQVGGGAQIFTCLKAAASATTVTLTHTSADFSALVMTYTGVGSLGTTSELDYSFVSSATISKNISADNSFIAAIFGWARSSVVTAAGVTGNVRANAAASTTLNGVIGLDNTAASSGSSVTNAISFSGGVIGQVFAIELKPSGNQGVLVANMIRVTNGVQVNNSVQVANAILVTVDQDWVDD